MEHLKSYPEFGEIEIRALKVKRDGSYYTLSENMLLGTAFLGTEVWFVFVDVAGTTLLNQSLHPTLTSCKLVSNDMMPNNISVRVESELNISSSEASDTKRRDNKKRKCEPTAVEAFASDNPAENAHKFENSNAQPTSFLEAKVLIPFSDGDAFKPNHLVGEKDDLWRKGNRYDNYDIADHGHDASSVSADAVTKNYIAKRSPELMGNLEGKISGSTHNQESRPHNGEAMSGSQVKKTRKTKKGGGDRIDRSHAVTSGKLADIVKDSVATFENEKVILARESNDVNIIEEGPPTELTDGSKLLLSQREATNLVERAVVNEEDAAVNLVERAKANVEDVAHLKSSELKVGESEKSRKKRRKNRERSTHHENQEFGGSQAAQPGQGPDAIQSGVTAIHGENLTCEKELDGKRIAEEEDVTEPKNTAKKKKTHKTKTPVASKQDLSSLEMLQSADISKLEQPPSTPRTRPASKLKTQLQESSRLPSEELLNEKMEMAAPKSVTESQVYHEELKDVAAVSVPAYEAEETKVDKPKASKKKTKKSKQIERTSETEQVYLEELEDVPAPTVPANVVDDEDKPKASKKKAKKSKQKVTDPADQSKVYLKELEDIPAPTVPANVAEDEDNSKASKKTTKKSKQNVTDPADQSKVYLKELEDIPAPTVPANVAEDEDNSKASKKTTKKSKQNVKTSHAVAETMNDNQVPAGTEQIESGLLQLATSSKPEENNDLASATPRKRSKSKQTSLAIDAPEIPATKKVDGGPFKNNSMSGNNHQKDLGDSKLEHLNETSVQKVVEHEADMRNLEKQSPVKFKRKKHSQPSAGGTSLSLTVSKKSYESERTSLVNHQFQSDGHETDQTNVIGAESVQPPKVGHPEINAEIPSDKPKTKLQTKHVAIKPKETVADGLLTNSSIANGDKQHLNGISVPKTSAHESDVTNLEKQSTRKSKRKKPGQPSADDTSNSSIANGDHQHLNGISVPKTSAHESDVTNLEKQTKRKSKRKKPDQPSADDTSSSLMTSKKGYPEVLSDKPKKKKTVEQADDDIMNNDVNNAEDEEKALCEKHQDGSATPEADIGNLEKQTTTKSKLEKLCQPSSVDTSSSFIPSDVHESLHSPQIDNPELNGDITGDKPKKRPRKKRPDSEKNLSNLTSNQQSAIEAQKPVSEQAATAANDDQNQDNISLHEVHHDGSTEVKKLDNQPESTLEVGKLDLSSSEEHNLITSKKSKGSEISGQVTCELQNDVQESALLSQSHNVQESVLVKLQEEQPDLLTNGNGKAAEHGKVLSPLEGHDNDPNEILSQDVSSAEKMKPEKSPASKEKVKNLDQFSSVDTKSKKENVSVSKKESASQNNSLDGSHLPKSIPERDGDKNPQSSTNNLTMVKKGTGSKSPVGENSSVTKSGAPLPNMNNRYKSAGTLSFAKRTHLRNEPEEVQKKNNQENVFKTPANKKVGKPAKILPPISGGLFADVSSDSSDSEIERIVVTRTPDDSSDSSEGDSEGDVVTSQGGTAMKNPDFNLSELKDMDLASILRSSILYKKTRAAQELMEDDESEPPDVVPDSQA